MADAVDAIEFLKGRIEYYRKAKLQGSTLIGSYYPVPADCRPMLSAVMKTFECDLDVAKSALIDLLRETKENPALG